MSRERIERRHAESPRHAAPPRRPAVAPLLGYGNAAVARAVLARQPKDFSLGADGQLQVQGAVVGDRGWVCVHPDSGDVGVPATDAELGRAEPGGALLAVRAVTIDKAD